MRNIDLLLDYTVGVFIIEAHFIYIYNIRHFQSFIISAIFQLTDLLYFYQGFFIDASSHLIFIQISFQRDTQHIAPQAMVPEQCALASIQLVYNL